MNRLIVDSKARHQRHGQRIIITSNPAPGRFWAIDSRYNASMNAAIDPSLPDMAPRPPRRGVVGVLVDGERLLLIRRSQHVVAPGKYCFPGGGMEFGETEQETLIRELREELNLLVRPVRRVWMSVTPWQVELCWWLAELPPGAVPLPNPHEVESFHWHTPLEMAQLPELLESNLRFLEALARGEIVLA